jgi:hypothetical protein
LAGRPRRPFAGAVAPGDIGSDAVDADLTDWFPDNASCGMN